ncbi:MAG TPA: hypothetical protein VEA41_09900 [Salinarimonas sp.]|nr:hypothetical protein [Salinarimonas sp.]
MRVRREQLIGIARGHGLEVDEGHELSRNFLKIGLGAYNLYPTAAAQVGRIDISGFVVRHPLVRTLDPEDVRRRKLGRVTQQIDFDLAGSPADVLEAFDLCCAMVRELHLAALRERAIAEQRTGRPRIRAAVPPEELEERLLAEARERAGARLAARPTAAA